MQTSAITTEALSGLFVLHLAMAVWTGVLASRWKHRSGWRWFGIGLVVPVAAPIVLAVRPRRLETAHVETEMELQYLDGTSLLR